MEEDDIKLSQNRKTFKVIQGSQIASVQVAEMHSMSRNVYREEFNDDPKASSAQKCPCCGYPVLGTRFPLCCNSDELSDLGTSFPLMFRLNKYLIISLVAVAAVAAIPCLIDNGVHSPDKWTENNSFNILTPATFGTELKSSNWQPILHVIICGLLMVFYLYIIRQTKNQAVELDTLATTPSDFTVVVRGLPAKYKKEELKKHIEENFSINELKIVNIVPTYNINNYMQATLLLNDWRFQYELVKNYEEKFQKPLVMTRCCCCKMELEGVEGCQSTIQELEAKQKEERENMNTENMGKIAFVMLSSQIAARTLAEQWERTQIQIMFDRFILCCCKRKKNMFKGKYIYGEMAMDHTDINWENIGLSTANKVFRRTITLIVGFITIGIACGIMIGTAYWKSRVYNNTTTSSSGNDVNSATIIPSIISVVINFAVARLTRIFSILEKHSTWTDYERSVFDLLILFILLNNIGIPIFVYFYLSGDWFSQGGLAYTVFWLEIMNTVASPLIYLFGPKSMFRNINKCLYRRKESQSNLNISQKQANLVFLGPEVDLPDRFVNMIKNFTLCLFYAPIVPIGVPIGIVGLVIEGMAFKYMLLRVHQRPRSYNSDLVIRATIWMRWGLLLYSLGIFIFYRKLVPEYENLVLYFFIAIAAYTMTPLNHLLSFCFKDNSLELIEKNYGNDEKYNNFFSMLPGFYSDYERENPATQEKGFKRWGIFMACRTAESYINLEYTKPKKDGIKTPDLPGESRPESPIDENGNLYPQLGKPEKYEANNPEIIHNSNSD